MIKRPASETRAPASMLVSYSVIMWFKNIAVVSLLLSVAFAAAEESNPPKKKYHGELYKKFDREIAAKSEEYAGEALDGVYTECLAQISFPCLQKKVLGFINRMNRMEKITLLGNYVSVVRTKDDYEPEEEFQARLDNAEQESSLDQMMEVAIDRFFNNHIIRFKIPNSFAVLKNSDSRSYPEESTALDFRFPFIDDSEGRKKGGGGGGGKMGKKMMMMMMMGLKAKMMMMGPLMMGMAGMMAMKALIAGVISLTISKIMLIKKLMKNKGVGGGGHGGGGWDSSGGGSSGWSSGGGGGDGWDRRNIHDRWDASNLAYRAYSTVENLF